MTMLSRLWWHIKWRWRVSDEELAEHQRLEAFVVAMEQLAEEEHRCQQFCRDRR